MPDFTYESLWNSPEIASHIDAGIEQHRKSDAVVCVEDSGGRPIPGTRVAVDQTSSDFLFGANIFMLGGYPSQVLNQRYEKAFTRLFNAATVPLYWRGLELQPGHLRFAADSVPVHRRPPVDGVVDFCHAHQLNMNGHCLVWDNVRHSIPDWLKDPAHCEAQMDQRIRQLAERYGSRIQRWDVLNEAVNRRYNPDSTKFAPMPAGYEQLAFTLARRYLPDGTHLMVNETTGASWWPGHRPRYHTLIGELVASGAAFHGIGLQWHLFSHEEMRRLIDGKSLQPAEMLRALDEFQVYRRPLHISEITLHSLDDDATGRGLQARITYLVYRLWFSHPAVHAITWWNLPDGGAVAGEDNLASGLIDADLQPKPAYHALHDLIHREWRTSLTATTDANGEVRFRGFHGRYRVTVDRLTDTIHIRRGEKNIYRLTLDGATIHHG